MARLSPRAVWKASAGLSGAQTLDSLPCSCGARGTGWRPARFMGSRALPPTTTAVHSAMLQLAP
eukprot:13383961-Alexandrium_andersonii.AAC.1